jgi:hypothetical protein
MYNRQLFLASPVKESDLEVGTPTVLTTPLRTVEEVNRYLANIKCNFSVYNGLVYSLNASVFLSNQFIEIDSGIKLLDTPLEDFSSNYSGWQYKKKGYVDKYPVVAILHNVNPGKAILAEKISGSRANLTIRKPLKPVYYLMLVALVQGRAKVVFMPLQYEKYFAKTEQLLFDVNKIYGGDGSYITKSFESTLKPTVFKVGSKEYFAELENRVKDATNKSVIITDKIILANEIKAMMSDWTKARPNLTFDENWDRFCETLNTKIIQVYTTPLPPENVVLPKDVHYFRNKLNYAPPTLEDMIVEYQNGNWVLYDFFNSAFHMNGPFGGFNLKFVEKGKNNNKGGKYEAVYNIFGELMTEDYFSLDMGTYNYCSNQLSVSKHKLLDVDTYSQFGNTPNEIKHDLKEYLKLYSNWNLYEIDSYLNVVINAVPTLINPLAVSYRINMADFFKETKKTTTKIKEYRAILSRLLIDPYIKEYYEMLHT